MNSSTSNLEADFAGTIFRSPYKSSPGGTASENPSLTLTSLFQNKGHLSIPKQITWGCEKRAYV